MARPARQRGQKHRRRNWKDRQTGESVVAVIDEKTAEMEKKAAEREKHRNLFEQREAEKAQQAIQVARTGQIMNPVEYYDFESKLWIIVDASTMDFPFPIKAMVDPEWAYSVLQERNPQNRKFKGDAIDKYKTDIINDDWYVINQGLGFYVDGTLADGQNRLWAILEAYRATPIIVVFGIDKKATPAIDEGTPRSTLDVAKMMNIDASKPALSTANYILEQRGDKRKLPKHVQIEFYRRHREAIHFVTDVLNKRGIRHSPVTAAVARAWYSQDKDRLAKFVQILQDGIWSDSADQAAYRLREWLSGRVSGSKQSGTFRKEVYAKTQAAIRAFMERRSITHLYAAQEELFYLPEEKK